ncbi:MAG TPA: glycerol kinase GlpK [Beijerinckiaceae bacterium]|nr:glycerol kinase GlpK [Beijerinckiaceae bacterium]
MKDFVGALDQGTTSTRFLIFDRRGQIVAADQREHRQIHPQPGWVEHDPEEIWSNCQAVVAGALAQGGLRPGDLAAVGLANQRETSIVWDRRTGAPLHNAIVWMDARTEAAVARLRGERGRDCLRERTGLPIASYFSGLKLAWLLEHAPGLRAMAESGEVLFGTVDSWLAWKLTGGPRGGVHVTDVTNASRTQMMNLESLQWDEVCLDLFGAPRACLPQIRSSSEIYGLCAAPLAGAPLCAILGDQQAALFGQACFQAGQGKATYGTGCFIVMNTGARRVDSTRGLLTTLAYRLGQSEPVYALEGSIAVAGSLVQWLRDKIGIVGASADIEALAASVPDSGGVVFVPAFSGLYAPHWNEAARGLIIGLTHFSDKAHLARAALEAVALQTHDALEAMAEDAQIRPEALKVDGGMSANNLFMQMIADLCSIAVERPSCVEATATGAAYAAGLAAGLWSSLDEIGSLRRVDRTWKPSMRAERRDKARAAWSRALARSLDWATGPS